MPTVGTINEEGVNVDMYIPRKCHATNQLIRAFDYASIQLNIGEIDPSGLYTGQTKTLCIAGVLRTQAESDHAINHLCIGSGIIRPKTGKKKKATRRRVVQKKNAPKGGKQAARKPAAKQGARKPVGAKGGKSAPKRTAAKGPQKQGGQRPKPAAKKAPAPKQGGQKQGAQKQGAPRPAPKGGRKQ